MSRLLLPIMLLVISPNALASDLTFELNAGRRWFESESNAETSGGRGHEINVAGYVKPSPMLNAALGPVLTYQTLDMSQANSDDDVRNATMNFTKVGIETVLWTDRASFRPYLKVRYNLVSIGRFEGEFRDYDVNEGAVSNVHWTSYEADLYTKGAQLGLGMQWRLSRDTSLVTEANFGFEMSGVKAVRFGGKKLDVEKTHDNDFNSKALLIGLAAGL